MSIDYLVGDELSLRLIKEVRLLNSTIDYLFENLDTFSLHRLDKYYHASCMEEHLVTSYGLECESIVALKDTFDHLAPYCKLQIEIDKENKKETPINIYRILTYHWKKTTASFEEVISLLENAIKTHENKIALHYYLSDLYTAKANECEDAKEKLMYAVKGSRHVFQVLYITNNTASG